MQNYYTPNELIVIMVYSKFYTSSINILSGERSDEGLSLSYRLFNNVFYFIISGRSGLKVPFMLL